MDISISCKSRRFGVAAQFLLLLPLSMGYVYYLAFGMAPDIEHRLFGQISYLSRGNDREFFVAAEFL